MANHSIEETEGRTPVSSATILLLVEHDQNRRLLADRLSQTYEVIESESTPLTDVAFDLCIVDGPSFRLNQEALIAKKQRQAPEFLPFLLLVGQQSTDRVPQEVWTVVDEVLEVPVNQQVLAGRIDSLLRTRRLSVELKRRKDRSEDRFKSLFQAAPDPVVVVNGEGTIINVNDAFGQVFDVEPEAVVSKQVTDLGFSPVETVENLLIGVGSGGHRTEGAENIVEWEGEGDVLIAELNADIVSGFSEETERIGVFRDITDLKKRERWLQRQNERLKEFAGTVAHDLRNPLNIAQGHLPLARDTGGGKHFEAIEQAQARMEQLVDEILELAQQGQTVLEPEAVSLEQVAESSWSHVDTEAVSLVVEADCPVMADEGRLCELFENLFRNAVEHGGEEVRVGPMDSTGGFYVEDTGPGIPAADRDQVFEVGYTSTADGIGFGLSIVRQIADGHGWDVTITDSDEGGARFEVNDSGQW